MKIMLDPGVAVAWSPASRKIHKLVVFLQQSYVFNKCWTFVLYYCTVLY